MAAREGSRKRKGQDPISVSIDVMRDKLGTYVNDAAVKGERYVVTRHGLPAAALVSIADLEKLEGAA